MQVVSENNYEVKARIALKIWLEANNISISMLAIKLNANLSGVWRWINGKYVPCLMTAIKLEELTNGAVACKLWKPTPIQKLAKKKVVKKDAQSPNKSKSHETDKHSKTTPKGKR